jgi:hypothetical protein
MRERAYTKKIMKGVGRGENILRLMEQRRRTTLALMWASQSTRRLYEAVLNSDTKMDATGGGRTFILIADQGPLLCLEELVPFALTLLGQKIFRDPRKKIRRSECLL